MKIAVPYFEGEIFQYFGKSENFKFYEVSDGKIVNSQTVGTDKRGHSELASFLF